jgi:hypothetical protein
MDLQKCPACGAEEDEGFGCYVAFLSGQYIYLFYCDDCDFKHLIPRIA